MLQKTNTNINFAQGLDTKTDPWQVMLGKFLRLVNMVFDKGGMLKKRNGFQQLPSLPSPSATYVTTLNGNLTALGTTVQALNADSGQWVTKGQIQPMQVSTLPLVRNSINQTQVDVAIAANGLICTAYTETNAGSTAYKYVIADSVTGQNVIAPTVIPVTSGVVTGSPRVFYLGHNFIVAFTNNHSGTYNLEYIAINSLNPTSVTANAVLAPAYTPAPTLSWDGVVFNNNLYFSYNTQAGGQAVKINLLTIGLVVGTATTFASQIATIMSVSVDVPNATIYASYYDLASTSGYTLAVNVSLSVVQAPVQIIAAGTVLNLTSVAQNGTCTTYYEVSNTYSYDSSVATNYINSVSVTSGTASSPYTVIRSVGLASKAFIIAGVGYFLSTYQNVVGTPYQNNGNFQPTYFLINGSLSTEASPVVSGKLAYTNGGGYLPTGLPNVTISGTTALMPYLTKDLIAAVNKGTNLPAGTQLSGIYSQTGINLAKLAIGGGQDAVEIASNLQFSGGFLWQYDGYLPVEQNFFLYPDNIEATWSASGGSIHAQPDGSTNAKAYWYQVTYEWSDNQGNIERSAPSLPIFVTTTGTGTSGSITLDIPTLRLTYKVPNPVKIVIYRWSVSQQIYYQVTSLTSAILNNTAADSISYTDTLADASILGNNIIYTNGGVVEDVSAPATNLITLFDTRLWLVDAEDQNLLWFSKQVIESTPVEMSDLFTFYIAPTTAAQGSTGPITAIAPMDDKLVIFKKNAIYYINGTGPDNTGANNQYSQPIFITSTVGCANQQSIVFMPQGLLFQSDKGIWLLGRGLDTQYIGAPVEQFNASLVQSAVNIPKENQVRFTLNTGEMLLYDYFYGQWGTFEGVPAITSCIYQDLHSYVDQYGRVFQENPGSYQDGAEPVLLSFTTSWLNLAGIQGYQRAYSFFLLGQYYSPHFLNLGIAYNYNPSIAQTTLIQPTNYSPTIPGPFGEPTPAGSPSAVEDWRIFLAQQRCTSLQVSLDEVYDAQTPPPGTPAGQGLSLSGINLVYAIKKGWRTISSGNTATGGQNRG
jgi:hypothetical protein